MTKHLIYYRRYMRDFEDGCHGLSWEQRGFYSAVIDEIYLAGGPVAIDWRVFAKRASSNAALAKRLLLELMTMGKLYVAEDGCIGNPRADREIRGAKLAIEKSGTVLPKHLAKHLAKEFQKTQQKLRARKTRAHPSTNKDSSSLLAPSFLATTGNGSAATASSPGFEGRSSAVPPTPEEEAERIERLKSDWPAAADHLFARLKHH